MPITNNDPNTNHANTKNLITKILTNRLAHIDGQIEKNIHGYSIISKDHLWAIHSRTNYYFDAIGGDFMSVFYVLEYAEDVLKRVNQECRDRDIGECYVVTYGEALTLGRCNVLDLIDELNEC